MEKESKKGRPASNNPKFRICLTVDKQASLLMDLLKKIYSNTTNSDKVNKSWVVRESLKQNIASFLEEYPAKDYPQYYKGIGVKGMALLEEIHSEIYRQ